MGVCLCLETSPSSEAARRAGEEKGKKQVEERRAREKNAAAAAALQEALARMGIRASVTDIINFIDRLLDKYKDFDLITALYTEGYRFITLGLAYLAGSAAFLLAASGLPPGPWSVAALGMAAVLAMVGTQLALRGMAMLAAATYLDQRFYQGRVFETWIRTRR